MSDIEICKCQGRYWQLHCIQCGLPFEPAVAERDQLKAKLAEADCKIALLKGKIMELERQNKFLIEANGQAEKNLEGEAWLNEQLKAKLKDAGRNND